MNEPDRRSRQPGIRALMLAIGLFVVVGSPLVYVIWSGVNELLSGQIVMSRLLLAVPALLMFLVVLSVLARVVRRLDDQPD